MGSFKFLSPALIEWYLILKGRVRGNKCCSLKMYMLALYTVKVRRLFPTPFSMFPSMCEDQMPNFGLCAGSFVYGLVSIIVTFRIKCIVGSCFIKW